MERDLLERVLDERCARCLVSCLRRLPHHSRELFLAYYEPGPDRSAHRQRLAAEAGLTIRGLRVKVNRLREKLEGCVSRCVAGTPPHPVPHSVVPLGRGRRAKLMDAAERKRLLSAYLQGTLSEDERRRLEAEYATDDALFEELIELENDAIDSDARDVLSAATPIRLVARSEATTVQAQRARFARALAGLHRAGRNDEPLPAAPRGRRVARPKGSQPTVAGWGCRRPWWPSRRGWSCWS